MWPGKHARERPDHPAYVMAGSGEVVTYARLDERSNRVAQLLHAAGLRFGDHIAVLMENRAEYFEPCWAAQRSGLTYTCINSHLTADEVARNVFAHPTLGEAVKEAVHGIAGHMINL